MNDPVLALFLNQLGGLYSGTVRLAEAERAFNEPLDRDPDHRAALIWPGDVRLKQG